MLRLLHYATILDANYAANKKPRRSGAKVGGRRRYGFCLACLARMALARASISAASVSRPVLRNKSA